MSVPPHLSPEYVAALNAQLDYDSTTEGQEAVEAALATCDQSEARGLTARLVSGRAARRFRSEQLALMPPSVRRNDPLYWQLDHLADARVDLARALATAAAETNEWGRPTPATTSRIVLCADAVLEAEQAIGGGEHCRPQHHPGPLRQKRDLRAPWAAEEKGLPIEPGDIGVLASLGVEAWWDGSAALVLSGDVDAAERWGYRFDVGPDGSCVSVSAPAIVRWFRGRVAAR